MRFGFGPDHEDIGDGRVRDPHLGAVQHIAIGRFLGHGLHAGGVRARIGFGQTKAADPFASGEFRQEFLALRFGAIGVDRIHDERGLHRHHRPIATVDALNLARDQAIGDVRRAQPAVFLGHRDAQQAHLTHFAENRRVGGFLTKRLDDTGLQLVLGIGAGGVAQHTLFVGQLVVQAEGVFPIKPAQIGGILGFQLGGVEHRYIS